MNMGISHQPFPNGIVDDVQNLIPEVIAIRNAMRVISLLPNLTRHLFSCRKRKPTLDQLRALFNRLVGSRCNQNMHMVRHDDKRVKLKLPRIAIARQRSDK